MPEYTCPSCGKSQGKTIWKPETRRHHCPECDDDIADEQNDLF